MAGLSETPAEVGRHNPVTHDYGSLEKHYEYDLVQFSKPYTRKVGTFFRTAPVAAPRDPPAPSVTASTSQEGGPSASASKGLPPPAAATAFSAAELAALSRQNVRQPYDPEDRFLFPQTASQEVGWGAKKMPPSSVRYPRKASSMTKTMERLRAVHSQDGM